MTQIKLDKKGWPKYMVQPSASDFERGDWASCRSLYKDKSSLTEEEVFSCGTRCCLVGWIGAAFSGPWVPSWARTKLSAPHREFMIEIIQRCRDAEGRGRYLDVQEAADQEGISFDPYHHNSNLMDFASSIFERSSLKEESFAQIWAETSEHFGYDVLGAK